MKSYGNRKFFQIPDFLSSSECGDEAQNAVKSSSTKKHKKFRGSTREMVDMVDRNIIGRETVFQGPFGPRRCVYFDNTASGQSLRCIEDFIKDNVLPYYGNTHTTSTMTSSQTTMFRQEAKDIVRNAVGASEHDVVIFCGSGCTGAVHKLVQAVMGSERPSPTVFVGPYEHHSSFLPWKDAGANVVFIPETTSGTVDVQVLEEKLKQAVAERMADRLLIGCFSVASNVTGALTDDIEITLLLHKYGALAFWDYSAAAPHVQILMNPVVVNNGEFSAKKDAIFFSGHKFVGGPQTPGVLIAKKALFENPIPNGAGGGSVFFVTKDSHRYLQNTEFREEGGTPAIVESIRLGLVFRLKETIGSSSIISRESAFTRKVLTEWLKYPQIKVLGCRENNRLAVISFVIEHLHTGYFLHHSYVVALLNDLYGIQARGGCACAGPYAQSLLGIDEKLALEYENLLMEDSRLDRVHLRRDLYLEGSQYEIFRPGFVRVSVPFHSSFQDVEYLIEAVQQVSRYGYKLLPLYNCNPETGEFHHYCNHIFIQRKWLSWVNFDSNGIRYKERTRNNSEDYPNYRECLEQARRFYHNAAHLSKRRGLSDQTVMYDAALAKLRWFLLPSEAYTLIHAENEALCSTIKSPRPFVPKSYAPGPDVIYNTDSVPHQFQTYSKGMDTYSLTCLPQAKISMDSFEDSGMNMNVNKKQELTKEFLFSAASLGATVTGPSICFAPPSNRPNNLQSNCDDSNLASVEPQTTAIPNMNFAQTASATQPVVRNGPDQSFNTYYQEIGNNTTDRQVNGFSASTTFACPNNSPAPVHQANFNPVISPVSYVNANFPAQQTPPEAFLPQHFSNSPSPQTLPNYIGMADTHMCSSPTPTRTYTMGYGDYGMPCVPQKYGEPTNVALSDSPVRSLPEGIVSEQFVENAMKRVTDELTHELKTEIREVISQVEQGININSNGSRERSSSFTLKNKKVEGFKRRARTYSGLTVGVEKDSGNSLTETSSNSSLTNSSCDSPKSNGEVQNQDTNGCTVADSIKKEEFINSSSSKWHCPTKTIFKPMLKAIREYKMIQNGDNVLVCLSGGKDSLSLLHCMKQAQFVLKKEGINFNFGAITVDPKHPGFNPKPLIPYLEKLNVPYFYEEQCIMDLANDKGPETVTSICSFCSRLKRGRIYASARKNGYNVLALGQHLDDLAESFMMSVLHNGLLRTQKAAYTNKEGDLRIIRPFIYVRETNLREFAESRGLPVIPENCPACFEAPKERQRIKQLLAHQEIMFPSVYNSLKAAMKPLMSIDRTGMESGPMKGGFRHFMQNDAEDD